jgi:hypothetical protein
MTPPDLPDDPRAWPDDPFAVLGVRPGAAEADIKRAYTRLIRRFKPEHSPEQFRRVREAYEACLQRRHWFAPPPDPEPELDLPPPIPPRPASPPVGLEPPPPPDPEPEPEAVRRTRRSVPPDEADRLWDLFADGREEEAYTDLAALAAARPDRPDLPLRLYWLLALGPTLDVARTRHDWLAAALARAGLTGPAAELYRRELEADPAAALLGPYADLMAAPVPAAHLLTVARWRVAAAGRAGLWNPPHRDLAHLRDRLRAADEGGWLGLVVAALDWCGWDPPEPLYSACRDELAALRHLGLSHSALFDRADELEHLAVGWRAADAAGVPYPVMKLARECWAGYGRCEPADLAAAAAAVAAEPFHVLRRFDRILESGPPAAGLARVMVGWLGRHHEAAGGPTFPPELVRGVFRAWLSGRAPVYADVRVDLVGFCAGQALHPAELTDALAADPDPRFRELAAAVSDDLSLRVVALLARGP